MVLERLKSIGLVFVFIVGMFGLSYISYIALSEMYDENKRLNRANHSLQNANQDLINKSDKITPEMEKSLEQANNANKATELANNSVGEDKANAMLIANESIKMANISLANANKSV